MLEHALDYASAGYFVFPLCWPNEDGTCGCGRNHKGKQVGKAPLTSSGWKDASNNPQQVRQWWGQVWPNANIGLATELSGIGVIDTDSVEATAEVETLGIPENTPCVKTGSGNGFHYYFRANGEPKTIKTHKGESSTIDVLTTNYVVVPPSKHLSGGTYEWVTERSDDLPYMPNWAVELLQDTTDSGELLKQRLAALNASREMTEDLQKRIKKLPKKARDIYSGKLATGDRSDTSYELACLAVEHGILTLEEIALVVFHSEPHKEKSSEKNDPERWGWEDALRCAGKALLQYHDKKADMIFEDGKFLANRLGDYLIQKRNFIFTAQRIHHYEDGYFKPNGEEILSQEVTAILGDKFSSHRVHEVQFYVETCARMDADSMDYEATNLINVENGMLNWRTGELFPHDPKYLSTMRVPVNYNPGAKCPNIEKFFSEITHEECIPILEEITGYVLIPGNPFRKAILLYGGGGNGKSKYLELVQHLIGHGNISNLPLQKLSEKFVIVELYGKLVNIFADLPSGPVTDSSAFKTVTGGDRVSGERKFKNTFSFTPKCKLLFSSNSKPVSSDKSKAYFDRWIIIPFPNEFIPGVNADEHLMEKITTNEELSGLLNLAVAGLRRLTEAKHFTRSVAVEEEAENYRLYSNPVAMFVDETCVVDHLNHDMFVRKTTLYDVYRDWCIVNSTKPLSQANFNKTLEEQFRVRVVSAHTMEDGSRPRVWRGIKFKEDLNESINRGAR